MSGELTLDRAIEILSQRENELRRFDDQELTSALILALNELKFLRALMAITSGNRTSLDFQHMSKDGFPGYPAE